MLPLFWPSSGHHPALPDAVESSAMAAQVHLGTSAFTAAGWEGSFYPAGLQPRDFLTYYATKFDTVEVDSTFYRTPSASTVRGWYAKTPANFIFALKVPQEITHQRCLVGCGAQFAEFLRAADLLREKLGPILFQFGYFSKSAFADLDAFLKRLLPFDRLDRPGSLALEYRGSNLGGSSGRRRWVRLLESRWRVLENREPMGSRTLLPQRELRRAGRGDQRGVAV